MHLSSRSDLVYRIIETINESSGFFPMLQSAQSRFHHGFGYIGEAIPKDHKKIREVEWYLARSK